MIKAIFFDLCGVITTLGDEEFCEELSKRININKDKKCRNYKNKAN